MAHSGITSDEVVLLRGEVCGLYDYAFFNHIELKTTKVKFGCIQNDNNRITTTQDVHGSQDRIEMVTNDSN